MSEISDLAQAKKLLSESREGIALLDVMLCVAVFGATVLIFTQWVHFYQRTVSLINNDEKIDNTMVKIADAFGSGETYCNYILSNMSSNPNPNPNLNMLADPKGAQVASIDLHDINGQILSNVVTLGKTVDDRQDLTMTDIRLRPVANLSPQEYVANLEFIFTRHGSIGGAEVVRRIPIHATVDPVTGFINSCTTTTDTAVHVQDII